MFKGAALAILAIFSLSSAFPRLQRFPLGHITVGCEFAAPNEFPYFLSLQYNGSHICGAALISPDAVVTAAHCVVGRTNSFSVIAGKRNLYEINEQHEHKRNIERVIVHPKFGGATGWSNDIAILRTSSPFHYSSYVVAFPIAQAGHTATGHGIVQGWVPTIENRTLINTLRKASLPIISDDECRDVFGLPFEDNMMCTGFADGVKACTLESGNPLVAMNRGFQYLAGIQSWGSRSEVPGYSVYTEISHHADFIYSNIIS